MKAKMPWFRMHAEFVDDPKVQLLDGELFKFWANCLGLACQNDGYLPKVAAIAWKMKLSQDAVSANIAKLYELGLLDQEADTFAPHNWAGRQYIGAPSTARVQRFRNKVKRVSETHETVSETPHETHETLDETVTETVSPAFHETHPSVCVSVSEVLDIKNFPKPKRRPISAPMSERFEEYFSLQPGKTLRRDLAAGVWAHEVTTENEVALFACLGLYLESAEVARGAVMNPENWLSECAAGKFTATWPKARDAAGVRPPNITKPAPYFDPQSILDPARNVF